MSEVSFRLTSSRRILPDVPSRKTWLRQATGFSIRWAQPNRPFDTQEFDSNDVMYITTIKWVLPAQVQVLLTTIFCCNLLATLSVYIASAPQSHVLLQCIFTEMPQSLHLPLLLLLLLFPLCHFHILRLPLCAFRILHAVYLARFRTSKSFIRHANAIIL